MDFVHPVEVVAPGVQGGVLAMLARTTGELDLRALARLARVSLAQAMPVPPAGVIVFRSFARGQADRSSDIDVVIVRPSDVVPDQVAWSEGLDRWHDAVRELTGNPVEMREVGAAELVDRLGSDETL